jgi:hypothetical protein
MPLQRPSSTWRDHYNPLRGLTMARIVAMEDAAERGSTPTSSGSTTTWSAWM